MKLHYKGKYDLHPESLPHGEHMPGAVKFKEAEDSKELAVIANVLCLVIMVVLAVPAFIRCGKYIRADYWQISVGCLATLLVLFPHELLHAVCFRKDVYLYTNWAQEIIIMCIMLRRKCQKVQEHICISLILIGIYLKIK